jgi:hypothetical protein
MSTLLYLEIKEQIMPGTLVITTLSDGTNSTSATNCIRGSARAWVNFGGGRDSAGNSDGSAGVINSSYNVSSVTVNSSADFTINFTNAMANSNYAVAGTAAYSSDVTNGPGRYISFGTQSTTQLRVVSLYTYNALQSVWRVCVTVDAS